MLNNSDDTPLHVASWNSYFNMVISLFKFKNINFHVRDINHRDTAFYMAKKIKRKQ